MDKRNYEDLSGLTEEEKLERKRQKRKDYDDRYLKRKKAKKLGLTELPPRKFVNEGKTEEEIRQRKLDLDKSYRDLEDKIKREEYLAKERERKRRSRLGFPTDYPIKPIRLDTETEEQFVERVSNFYTLVEQYKASYRKAHYKNNVHIEKEQMRKYREINSDYIKEISRKHYYKNKEQDPEYTKKLSKRQVVYHKKKRLEDPQFVAKISLRGSLRQNLKMYAEGKKSKSAIDLIGCTIEEFVEYISDRFLQGMTWTPKNFHLDHIKPCSSFDLTDPEQQKLCFHYSNFQPLWPVDNLRKHARLDWKHPDKYKELVHVKNSLDIPDAK